MLISHLSVFGQCQRCKATLDVGLNVRGTRLVSIEPDINLNVEKQIITHTCGGDIRLFNMDSEPWHYVVASKKLVRRTKPKTNRVLVMT